MKRFRFRLQRLLEIRQQETKVALNHFAQARQATRAAQQRLEIAAARRAASAEELLARRQRRMTVQEWRWAAEMHESLVAAEWLAAEWLAAERLAAAQQEEERRRRELTEAERREKVLERLRERRFAEFQQMMAAAEQAAIDEMAQTMYREGGGRR